MSNILASKWQFKCSGTILPARIIGIAAATGVSTAIAATDPTLHRCVGVTKNHGKYPIGSYESTSISDVAAEAGDALDFWGPGEIGYVTLAASTGTIAAADLINPLIPATGGKATTVVPGGGTTRKQTIGYPLATGVPGDIIPVWIWPENVYTA